MKKSLLAIALTCLLGASSYARTWTSADGSKSFEGEVRSYDASSKTVSVLSGGRVMTFTEDKLSEADRTYLQEWEAERNAPDPAEQVAATAVGKTVQKSKLHRLNGTRFRSADMEKAPDYYILYYSASW